MNFRYEQTNESKKKQNIQETVEYILNRDYGTTISNTELAKILQYQINDEDEYRKYKSIMNKVRNFVLQYGYVLKSIAGIGYYILKPEQISNHCFKTYIKSASRLYDKSSFVLDRVDRTRLTDIRLEELENIKNLTQQLTETTDKIVNESKYYSRKSYYDSLEDEEDTNINPNKGIKASTNNCK